MSKFFINKPVGFESTIKTIVKQTFPFAAPSELALAATDSEMRGFSSVITGKVAGSKRERFVWGISRMGSSRIIG